MQDDMMESFEMESLFRLNHNPKPINYSEEVTESFKMILWYTPNAGSYQAQQDYLIDEKYINDELFSFFCSLMNIDSDDIDCREYAQGHITDQIIHELNPEDDRKRIVMIYGKSKTGNLTKMQSLLEHLRNSIAHGRFSIIDSYFVGFDYNGNKKQYTFFIRVRVNDLKRMLYSITVPDSKNIGPYVELIVRQAFSSLEDYIVVDDNKQYYSNNHKYTPDLLVKRISLNKVIAVEIKIAKSISSFNKVFEKTQLWTKSDDNDKLIVLLIIPNKEISSKTVEKLNMKGAVVLDRVSYKLFLDGFDVISNQIK